MGFYADDLLSALVAIPTKVAAVVSTADPTTVLFASELNTVTDALEDLNSAIRDPGVPGDDASVLSRDTDGTTYWNIATRSPKLWGAVDFNSLPTGAFSGVQLGDIGLVETDNRVFMYVTAGLQSLWTEIVFAYEPALGDPDEDGQVLSSLANGTRAWIDGGAGLDHVTQSGGTTTFYDETPTTGSTRIDIRCGDANSAFTAENRLLDVLSSAGATLTSAYGAISLFNAGFGNGLAFNALAYEDSGGHALFSLKQNGSSGQLRFSDTGVVSWSASAQYNPSDTRMRRGAAGVVNFGDGSTYDNVAGLGDASNAIRDTHVARFRHARASASTPTTSDVAIGDATTYVKSGKFVIAANVGGVMQYGTIALGVGTAVAWSATPP